MDELRELIIYRGYKATLSVTVGDGLTPSELGAVAYSLSTGEKFAASASVSGSNVTFTWPALLTAQMKAGTYNLEFHSADELYEVRKDFVKVQRASPADGIAVVVEEESSSESSSES